MAKEKKQLSEEEKEYNCIAADSAPLKWGKGDSEAKIERHFLQEPQPWGDFSLPW